MLLSSSRRLAQRCLSTSPAVRAGASAAAAAADAAPLRYSSLVLERGSGRPVPADLTKNLVFGAVKSEHMLEVDWSAARGWQAPRIFPVAPLSLDPAASCLHYGLQAFEGMKAYRDAAARPPQELVRVDKRWIPRGEGFSLYLRPTVISTWPYLGVSTAQSIKLFVVACPVGPYYATGFKPTTLYADAANVRAWPGGTGDSKLGGNYAPTIRHLNDVASRGFSQTLWLFGSGGGGQVTEVGTMNFFVVWRTPAGRTELATAPLDGTILPGVTRQSILDLARARWPDVDVAEKHFTIDDVAAAARGGRLLEAFGAGTAAVVSPVKKIHVAATGADIDVPCGAPADGAGPIARRAWNELADIQYGRVAHPWSVVVG